jgi:hypothetical protein
MTRLHWFTAIGCLLVVAPIVVWMSGVSPFTVMVANVASLGLVIRMFLIVSRLSSSRSEVLWTGFAVGGLGGIFQQLLLHLGWGADNLAALYGAYAAWGSRIYQLQEANLAWPFVFVGILGAFYAGLATLVDHFKRLGAARPWQSMLQMPGRNL